MGMNSSGLDGNHILVGGGPTPDTYRPKPESGTYQVEVTVINGPGDGPGATIYYYDVTSWEMGDVFLRLDVLEDYIPEAPSVRTNKRGRIRRYIPLGLIAEFVSAP